MSTARSVLEVAGLGPLSPFFIFPWFDQLDAKLALADSMAVIKCCRVGKTNLC